MCSCHIYHNFSCCDDLSKYGKEYLNSLKCEFCTFFSIKFRKFWHTARLSRTNRHKVIKSENSPVFLAHPVYNFSWNVLYAHTWIVHCKVHREVERRERRHWLISGTGYYLAAFTSRVLLRNTHATYLYTQQPHVTNITTYFSSSQAVQHCQIAIAIWRKAFTAFTNDLRLHERTA